MFRVAEDWARNRGLDSVIGPLSPNMMGEMGFLVDGFDRDPAILMPYNKPYYDRLVQGCGYAKEMDLLAYSIDRNSVNLEHLERGERAGKDPLPEPQGPPGRQVELCEGCRCDRKDLQCGMV